ncbi:MAG: serine hydrolase domain-containing protein [Gemmatimonadota bacterium]
MDSLPRHPTTPKESRAALLRVAARRYRRRSRILLIVLPATAAACVGPRPQQASVTTPAARSVVDSLQRLVPLWLDSLNVRGAAVALVDDGAVVWEQGFGSVDRRGTPVTRATRFQVGSISKSVTAWGVVRLLEDQRISLDAPVQPFLKRWTFPSVDSGGYANAITFRQLLSHTAGLTVSGYAGTHPDSVLPSVVESLRGTALAPGVTIANRPGARWQYSGGGYTVLQLLVEELSRQSFPVFMRDAVLHPLNMSSSTFAWSEVPRDRASLPFASPDSVLPSYRFAELAAAGLWATAGDIGRFVAASVGGPVRASFPQGLSPVTLEAMQTPAPNAEIPQMVGYGLGYLLDSLASGERVITHNGVSAGWRALYVAVPARRAGVVILTNSESGMALNNRVACAWIRVALQAARRGCRAA